MATPSPPGSSTSPVSQPWIGEAVDRLRTVLDDAEAGADTGLLRVDLAYALCRRGDHAEAASALALAAEEGDLARAGEIAATSRAEFAARGFGRPFTVDRLVAAEG